jgi:hypothetical protein
MKKLPKAFQRILWSYRIEKLDTERDKKEIITRVLNYGTWDDLKLLQKIYTEEDIKQVVSSPERGCWFEKVLNFWTKLLNLQLDKETYEKAIMKMEPGDKLIHRKPRNRP